MAKKSKKPKVYHTSNSDDWGTPGALYKGLDQEYGFSLDVAASPGNAKCDQYLTQAMNALEIQWWGRVWMNPPYSQTKAFLTKMIQELVQKHIVLGVALVAARTDTKWFWEAVQYAGEVRFLKGRLKFEKDPSENYNWTLSSGSTVQFKDQANSAPFPSAILIFDRRPKQSVIWWDWQQSIGQGAGIKAGYSYDSQQKAVPIPEELTAEIQKAKYQLDQLKDLLHKDPVLFNSLMKEELKSDAKAAKSDLKAEYELEKKKNKAKAQEEKLWAQSLLMEAEAKKHHQEEQILKQGLLWEAKTKADQIVADFYKYVADHPNCDPPSVWKLILKSKGLPFDLPLPPKIFDKGAGPVPKMLLGQSQVKGLGALGGKKGVKGVKGWSTVLEGLFAPTPKQIAFLNQDLPDSPLNPLGKDELSLVHAAGPKQIPTKKDIALVGAKLGLISKTTEVPAAPMQVSSGQEQGLGIVSEPQPSDKGDKDLQQAVVATITPWT
jgi:phage N-6-adenine-methyltransferase